MKKHTFFAQIAWLMKPKVKRCKISTNKNSLSKESSQIFWIW